MPQPTQATPMDDARVRALVQEELRSGAAGILIRQLQSVLVWGDGAPSAAPANPRAVYVNLSGGVGSTGYAWTGAAWNNFV